MNDRLWNVIVDSFPKLLEYGLKEKLLDEIKGFFGDMARVTGTLWEHANAYTGSLNHGFAAYAATAMVECLA